MTPYTPTTTTIPTTSLIQTITTSSGGRPSRDGQETTITPPPRQAFQQRQTFQQNSGAGTAQYTQATGVTNRTVTVSQPTVQVSCSAPYQEGLDQEETVLEQLKNKLEYLKSRGLNQSSLNRLETQITQLSTSPRIMTSSGDTETSAHGQDPALTRYEQGPLQGAVGGSPFSYEVEPAVVEPVIKLDKFDEELNVSLCIENVANRDLALYEARVQTYDNWPEDKPSKESMANAGFAMQKTIVRCFCCNMGLLISDIPDDKVNPYQMHAEAVRHRNYAAYCDEPIPLDHINCEYTKRRQEHSNGRRTAPQTSAASLQDPAPQTHPEMDVTGGLVLVTLKREFGHKLDQRMIRGVVEPMSRQTNYDFRLNTARQFLQGIIDKNPGLPPPPSSPEARNSGETSRTQAGEQESGNQCTICCDGTANTQLVPCMHLVCNSCSRQINNCPYCRSEITQRAAYHPPPSSP